MLAAFMAQAFFCAVLPNREITPALAPSIRGHNAGHRKG
jgi:hypothetical protein